MRYQPHMPAVLQGISLSVAAQHKVRAALHLAAASLLLRTSSSWKQSCCLPRHTISLRPSSAGHAAKAEYLLSLVPEGS